MIAPARIAAFDILSAVSSGRADLPTAVASARRRLRDPRDQALAADIATGVQRWRAALDHLIVTFSKRPIARLDPEIVEVLRLGAYQLLHHSRAPASAVVDDAVDLARRAGKRSATGLVNAVLRAISRKRQALPLPPRPEDPADHDAALDYLSVNLSHPRWLVARWVERFGFDATETWLRFNNSAAPLTVRANTLVTSRDALASGLNDQRVATPPTRFAPDGLIVDTGHLPAPPVPRSYLIQDEASQLVGVLAHSELGWRVLDTCASPGGKTTALAAAVGRRGVVIACDVRPRRMDLLRRTVESANAGNVRLVQANLEQPLPFSGQFDLVLVDAPCSGLGILRRDPDIRWRRREEDLVQLAANQRRMLAHAATVVTPRGRLVYATCSSEPDENDAVADGFLSANRDFSFVHARVASPELPEAVVDGHGYLRTLPYVHGLEAFFGAVFERRPAE